MYSNKFNNITESAHIGTELLLTSSLSDMERKCLIIKQCVEDGDFNLEEALALYEVPQHAFENFLVKYILQEMQAALSSFVNPTRMTFTIVVFKELYKKLFLKYDNDAEKIIQHFDSFSKDVNEGRVKELLVS